MAYHSFRNLEATAICSRELLLAWRELGESGGDAGRRFQKSISDAINNLLINVI